MKVVSLLLRRVAWVVALLVPGSFSALSMSFADTPGGYGSQLIQSDRSWQGTNRPPQTAASAGRVMVYQLQPSAKKRSSGGG